MGYKGVYITLTYYSESSSTLSSVNASLTRIRLVGVKLIVFNEGFCDRPSPEVLKLFFCSTQLRLKFKLSINIEIAQIN